MDLTTTTMGPPHGPEGEKVEDMPARPREVPGAVGDPGKQALLRSPSAPNGAPSSCPGNGEMSAPDGPCAPSGSERKAITRATGKIYLDPRDAAEQPDEHRTRGKDTKRLCGGPEKCSACRFYFALDAAGRNVVQVMNTSIRRLWQLDGAALDRLRERVREGGEKIDWKKDWPLPNVEGEETAPQSAMYRFIRRLAPGLASGIAATLSDKVIAKWKETRFDTLVRETKSPPHFRRGFPVPIRAQSFRLKRASDPSNGERGDRYVLRFSLAPGRYVGGAEFAVPIRPRDGYQARSLRMLADGRVGGAPDEETIKIGEAKIAEDKRHPGKWQVTFSYTRLAPAQPTTEVSAGINRGIICFLAAVTSTGRQWLYDGEDIEAFLKRLQARRKRYQWSSKASGRSGHGRARMLAPLDKLEAKGERWRATKCQTIARRFVAWIVEQGVTVLYMENLSGIRDGEPEKLEGGKFVWDRIQEWPYYQLGERIQSCCAEAGIEVVERPAFYVSQRCPVADCGYTDESNVDLRHRMFCCQRCGYKRHLDAVAAENVRRDGERDRAEAAGTGARNGETAETKGGSGGGRAQHGPTKQGKGGALAKRRGRGLKNGGSRGGGGNGSKNG